MGQLVSYASLGGLWAAFTILFWQLGTPEDPVTFFGASVAGLLLALVVAVPFAFLLGSVHRLGLWLRYRE